MDRKPVGRDEFRDEALRVLWQRVANAVLTAVGFDDVANALKPPGSGPELVPSEHFGSELELLLDTLAYLTSSPSPAWMGQLEEQSTTLASTYGLLRHRLEHVLDATLRSSGFAPAPAWFGAAPDHQAAATEIISVLVSATYEGAALRTDFDPLGRGFSLPTGIDGSPQWWDLAALAHHLILTAFSAGTTTDTIRYRDLPPVDAPVPGYGAGPKDEIIRVSLELLNAKIASDITEPVQFDELVERLQSATDPSKFWPSPNHLWEKIIRQYAGRFGLRPKLALFGADPEQSDLAFRDHVAPHALGVRRFAPERRPRLVANHPDAALRRRRRDGGMDPGRARLLRCHEWLPGTDSRRISR